jgi:hypothetical protein
MVRMRTGGGRQDIALHQPCPRWPRWSQWRALRQDSGPSLRVSWSAEYLPFPSGGARPRSSEDASPALPTAAEIDPHRPLNDALRGCTFRKELVRGKTRRLESVGRWRPVARVPCTCGKMQMRERVRQCFIRSPKLEIEEIEGVLYMAS